jgi:LytR cell envelope-related transcriptional attenuator
MHAIESIGPVLGIIAFVGLAVLAFLIFQQARDLRRLREWAGRAPERAAEAVDAVQAAAESRREPGTAMPEDELAAAEGTGIRGRRLGAAWARVKGAFGPPLSEVDRRLPVDGRYLLALAAVALATAAVLTSGFGLVGGSSDKNHKHASAGPQKVAVLNGTSVSGLAARVEQEALPSSGYKATAVTNTGSSIANTVVMYEPGHEAGAKALVRAIEPKLGKTPVQEMTSEIKARAGGAPLALTVGIDDAGFGGG